MLDYYLYVVTESRGDNYSPMSEPLSSHERTQALAPAPSLVQDNPEAEGVAAAHVPERVDDDFNFKIEYHPSSGLLPRYQRHEEYLHSSTPVDPARLSSQPWWPFKSRLDFTFAKFVTETSLSRGEVEKLLAFIKMVRKDDSEFTIESYKDLECIWSIASKFHIPVCVILLLSNILLLIG